MCSRSRRVCTATTARRIEGYGLAVGRSDDASAVGCRDAELGLGALDAVVWLGLRPVITSVVKEGVWAGWTVCALGLTGSSCNGLHSSAHGGRHSDRVGIVPSATFDAIAGWQKCIKPLNKRGVAGKKLGDAIDYAGRVDASEWERGHQSLHSGDRPVNE